MNTASIIRHLLTYLAGIGGVLLSWNLIAPDQVESVNAAAAELMAPLAVIAGAVAATVARLVIGWVQQKFAGRGAGDGDDTNTTTKVWLALFWVGTMAGPFAALPSCSTLEGAGNIPIKACYIDEAGNQICYSSKGGLEVAVDKRSGK